MSDLTIREKQLFYMEFINRENQFRHMDHNLDRLQFELLRDANPKAVEMGTEAFSANLQGHLSDNPLRNYKYLFVASVALCCRYCMEGGMDQERAYNASDLYIQKMDQLETEEEVIALHRDMLEFYLREMTAVKKQKICSKPVMECMDYIYNHLYEQIHVADLAEHVGLNESYLSALFKKETGRAVSDYIRDRRVEAAEGMLRYSDYSYSDIANFLAFSSQSHFTSVFRKATGLTPGAYRAKYAEGGSYSTGMTMPLTQA